jgi:DNA replication and repair protein RecF
MLKGIHLYSFRNYRELEFAPAEGFMILSGANGSGKSNLCESIYYLGSGYSYRQCHDEALINTGSRFFAIKGEVRYGKLAYVLEAGYQDEPRRKIFKVNGKRVMPGKAASYFPAVIFSPADLLLLQGSPPVRRRFLDLVTSQVRPQHAAALHHYQGILLQRNNLLKQGVRQESLLHPWDEQLIAAGSSVIAGRLSVLRQLLDLSREIFHVLGGNGALSGSYQSQVAVGSGELDEMSCRELFRQALERSREREQRFKATIVGPHRDDLRFYLAEHEARIFCSQGEQRLIALSLKIAQNLLLAAELENEPLLLLDDVFSELDRKRRGLLLQEFCRHQQVIATTTGYNGNYTDKREITPEITVYQL